MSTRWSMLAMLFSIRTTMAFQFQAVAALSPLMMEAQGVGLADIGLLIGLYLAPGILIAAPGGAIGARLGDTRAVALGLVLMFVGGAIMTVGSAWEHQIAGRAIAGVGGILINVLMSKMVTDWFAGREIATAMGIFVNSWPVGIAAALIVLPPIAEAAGLQAALGIVAALALPGLLLLCAYRSPPRPVAATQHRESLRGAAFTGVLIAGSIWGLYNAALGMVFGFGPAMLAERGYSITGASSTISLSLWLIAVSVPLGGWLADRSGRRDEVLVLGVLAFACAMLTAYVQPNLIVFAAVGLVGGLAAGPIMSLPAEVLRPGNRAQGMGAFYTFFYVLSVMVPIMAGSAAEHAGRADVTFLIGAALLGACSVGLLVFRLVRRSPGAEAA